MFFFFVGGVEQGAGRLLKEAAGRCLRCGGTADLVETEKALKLFFRERREGRRQESSPLVICSPLYLFMLAGCAGI